MIDIFLSHSQVSAPRYKESSRIKNVWCFLFSDGQSAEKKPVGGKKVGRAEQASSSLSLPPRRHQSVAF